MERCFLLKRGCDLNALWVSFFPKIPTWTMSSVGGRPSIEGSFTLPGRVTQEGEAEGKDGDQQGFLRGF